MFARLVPSELVVDDIGLLPGRRRGGRGAAPPGRRRVREALADLDSNLHPARFHTIFPEGLDTATVNRLLHHADVTVKEGRSPPLIEAVEGRGVRPLDARELG